MKRGCHCPNWQLRTCCCVHNGPITAVGVVAAAASAAAPAAAVAVTVVAGSLSTFNSQVGLSLAATLGTMLSVSSRCSRSGSLSQRCT